MTKRIPDFERYASEIAKITQRDELWCIPANIESVTKYFVPNSPVTQEYLWNKCCNPSFSRIKADILDVDPNYSQFTSRIIEEDISVLVRSIIPSEIEKGPVVLSLPAAEPSHDSHVYTVVEWNDLGVLRAHDTGIGKFIEKNLDEMKAALKKRNRTGTDVLIIRPK